MVGFIKANGIKNKLLGIEAKKMTFCEAFDWMIKEFSDKVDLGSLHH